MPLAFDPVADKRLRWRNGTHPKTCHVSHRIVQIVLGPGCTVMHLQADRTGAEVYRIGGAFIGSLEMTNN